VYGAELEVFLLHFKRPERRFDSVEALKAQMTADIAAGREYHQIPFHAAEQLSLIK